MTLSKKFLLFFEYFLLFLAVLYFDETFLKIIQSTWLKELFLSFKSNLIGDLLVTGISAYIFWQFLPKAKKRYKFSIHYFYFFSFLTLYYFLLRFFETFRPQFEFTGFSFVTLKYFDLIFCAWIIGIITFFIKFKKKKTVDYLSKLKHDNPIEKVNDDKLGYDKIASKVVKEVLELKPSQRAFNIGINGEWGSGKTSLINLLVHYFEEEDIVKESEHLLIRFSPLLIDKSSNLTSDFLLKLNNNLKNYSIESSNNIRQYIYSLTSKINDLWGLFIGIFYKDKNYEIGYEEVKRIIQKIDRRIIVIIDDLDRLNKDEILEILRLIRNICDFPNMVFIIAYDKSYLCDKLNIDGERNADKYLEKFFTLDICLPSLEKNVSRQEILTELSKSLPGLSNIINTSFNVNLDGTALILSGVESTIVPLKLIDLCISTKRDVVRFINSILVFNISYFDEIIFSQFCILELIKLKYFEVYSAIRSKKILDEPSLVINYCIPNKNYKNELLNAGKYSTLEAVILENAIDKLFYVKKEGNTYSADKKSIVNQNRFYLYFSLDESNYVEYSKMESLRE